MQQFEVKKSYTDAQSHTQESSWKRVLVHIAIALITVIFAVLHIVQPDIDFTERTSIFLRPLSPLWIAVPLSVIYPLWLIGLIGNGTTRKVATVAKTCAGNSEIGLICLTGIVCALTLTLEAINILIMYHKYLYSDLPNYEAGNSLVECQWLDYIFMVLLVGAILTIPVLLQWMPVMTIMGKWTKAIMSKYIGDQGGKRLVTNIDKSIATGTWYKEPSAIDGYRSAQLGPNENEIPMDNVAMLSDWEVLPLDANSERQQEKKYLKCFQNRLAALHDTAGDLHGRG